MIVLTALMLIGQVEIHTYNPPGCINNQGMYADITSRCPANQRHKIRHYNRVIGAHEITHLVNNDLRNRTRKQAFYLGNGQVVLIDNHPKITLTQIAALVPPEERNETFNQYLVKQAEHWNDKPLYILDEWVAYKNDAKVAREEGLSLQGGDKSERHFHFFAKALILAVLRHDPHYQELVKLKHFIDYLVKH